MRPSLRLVHAALLAAAITVAAGLLEIDWLAWAPWGALALVALADLAASRSGRGLTIAAEAPARGFVGECAPLSVRIAARRGALPARIELRAAHDPGMRAEPGPPARPGGRSEIVAELPLRLLERGDRQVTRLWLRYASRLGLFEILPSRTLDLTIAATPNIRPALSGEIMAQMLPLTDGRKDMRLRGEGSEFHQLREFLPGMDPRTIDWKRSARAHGLVARETRAERNHQIILCVDSGRLMGEKLGDLSRLDHALNAALALAYAAGLAGDTVGFYNFDSRPRAFSPPRGGQAAFGQILQMSTALRLDEAETNHAFGLSHLNATLKRRSLVVILSDFADPVTAELLVEHVAAFTRRHLALYVSMRDPALQATAQPEEIGMDAVARAVAARQMLRERGVVLDKLGRMGVAPIDAPPGALTPALLNRYIEIKSREML